jgi:hypothetical protein
MRIELVSLRYDLYGKRRLEQVVNIINNSEADLILFCGHTVSDYNCDSMEKLINNKKSFIVFEVKSVVESQFVNLNNCLYTINRGHVQNLFTNQLFATSEEIENNVSLCERFVYELETRRRVLLNDKKFLILQCGELNIIKNIQKEDNRPVFRLDQSKNLKERFDNLLNDTDIILNPIHTPRGNQGKMEKRREYLSDKNRYYFSTSQNDTREIKGKKKTIPMDSAVLQYALHNGIALQEERYDTTSLYTIRVFDI